MNLKKNEEINYYEVLNIKEDASQEEIENAYTQEKRNYAPDSLALYGLLSEDERRIFSKLIEEAYQVLKDPVKRNKYNLAVLKIPQTYRAKAPFRKTTEKLTIELVVSHKSLWQRIKDFFYFRKQRKA